MAKVIPVGPIDPVLYGFAKNQAEKAERDPRYVPKRLETPAHSITYRRVGATVKAFVIDKIAPVWTGKDRTYALPVVQNMPQENIPQTYIEAKQSNALRFANNYFKVTHGFNGYESKRISAGFALSGSNSDFCNIALEAGDYSMDVLDNSVDVSFVPVETEYANRWDILQNGLIISNSSEPYEFDDTSSPVFDIKGKFRGTLTYESSKSISSSKFAAYDTWLLPAIRTTESDDATGGWSAVTRYNYVQSATEVRASQMVYAKFNAKNFNAKTRNEILPAEIIEGAKKSYTVSFNFNPSDIWYAYHEAYFYGLTRKSEYPVLTTSKLQVDSPYGKISKCVATAIDCTGEFFYVEVSASTNEINDVSPPWTVEPAKDGDKQYPYTDKILKVRGIELPNHRTITVYKNGLKVIERNVSSPDGSPDIPFHNLFSNVGTNVFFIDQFRLKYNETTYFGSMIFVELYASMEPTGGAALVFCDTNYESDIRVHFGVDALDCASVFVKRGIFALGYDYKATPAEDVKHCVVFIPNPTPEDLHPAIRMSKEGEPKNYYLLRPHKKYDTEKETELNRFTRASLFVSAKNPNPTEKGRRCYISFDDGVCMDLTDFADALEADPNISADDWDGKPFMYSPMEPIDTEAEDYDYWDFKPRRIKRAYAPQWVRAYYDYEDQP